MTVLQLREKMSCSLETFQKKGTPNQKKTYGKVTSTEMIGENGIKMNFINNEIKSFLLLLQASYRLSRKNIIQQLMLQKRF